MATQEKISHPLPDAFVERVAERFRVLGEPMRIRVLERLREGEATVSDLQDATGASQQNVSKHLGVLLREGVVQRRKEGNFSHYSIADPLIFALCDDVCGSLQREVQELESLLVGRSR